MVEDPDHLSIEVHQATGMVAARLGYSIAEALARLREQAETEGKTLDEVAADVIARVTRFGP